MYLFVQIAKFLFTGTPCFAMIGQENTGETQLTFFETMPDPVKEKLKSLDLMNTTPSQALQILEDLQKNL